MQTPTGRMLATLPDLAEHVTALIGGIRQRPLGGTTSSPWEAPLPLSGDAFDDVNRLWVALLWTVRGIADETRSTLPGPAAHAWRTKHGDPIGLPPATKPDGARYMIAVLARWIDAQLPYLADPDAALYDLYLAYEGPRDDDHPNDGIRFRYPLRDRTRVAKDAICEDDRGTLAIKPPRFYGDEPLAVCTVCQRVYTQDQVEELAVRFAAIEAYARAAARSRKVAEGLARKYGTAV